MNNLLTILIPIIFGFLSLDPLLGQVISEDTPPPQLEFIESKLSALNDDSTIDDKEKLVLTNHYNAAIQFLQNASKCEDLTTTYIDILANTPEDIESWKIDLQQLELAEKTGEATPLPKDIGNLQKIIDEQNDDLKKLTQRKSELAEQLALIEKRPLQISTRLGEIQMRQSELKELFNQTADSNSALQTAQTLELLSERHAITAERHNAFY